MQNGGEKTEMIDHIVGDLMIIGTFAALGLLVWFAYWSLGGGAWRWTQERKEQKELERFEEEDADRAQDWDMERAQELAKWVRQGVLPSPIARLYPAYQEFTWEWARLQAHGYQLDHDPVKLDDGQLMVTYSRQAQPQLRIAR